MEDLRSSQDSLVENVAAFRYVVERIEKLDGYRRLCRDLLKDCRGSYAAMITRIDHVLEETSED